VQSGSSGRRCAAFYDNVGNVLEVTDANGHKTVNTYDGSNRLLTTTNAESIKVEYRYDEVGNRTKVIDGRGKVTEFEYDGLKRLTRTTDPLQHQVVLKYDGVNKTDRVDALNRTTKYGYDVRDRLETVTYEGNPVDNCTYGYDMAGNLQTVTTPASGGAARNVSYTYDALRRVTSVM
jgi:YD repeat-containing protein